MGGLRQIKYGMTDFARIRAEDAHFVDRTDLIRELFGGLKIAVSSTDERDRHLALIFNFRGLGPRIFDISKGLYAFACRGG